MANALGIDLGEVYRTVEAVKTSRAARSASDAATTKANAISEAAATANPAKPETMAPLIALDPKMAGDVTAAYTAMDTAARTKAKEQTDKLGQLAYGVQSAQDPAAAYAQVLAQIPVEQRGEMPPAYDPNWVTLQLARAREIDSIYSSIDAQAADTRKEASAVADDARGQTNALALEGVKQDNAIALEGVKSNNTVRETVAKAEATGAGGPDTAASNAVSRATAALFGGTFGPDGSFGGMDQQQAVKALEVASEAERLMKGKPGLAVNDAVRQAAEAVGYKVGGTNRSANNQLANGGDPMATGPASDPFNLGL